MQQMLLLLFDPGNDHRAHLAWRHLPVQQHLTRTLNPLCDARSAIEHFELESPRAQLLA